MKAKKIELLIFNGFQSNKLKKQLHQTRFTFKQSIKYFILQFVDYCIHDQVSYVSNLNIASLMQIANSFVYLFDHIIHYDYIIITTRIELSIAFCILVRNSFAILFSIIYSFFDCVVLLTPVSGHTVPPRIRIPLEK